MEFKKLPGVFLFLLISVVYAYHDRIIGGWECSPNKHPSLVLLYDHQKPFCSGTLLSRDWVITAAHCYLRANIQIRLGVHNVDVPRGYEQVRESKSTKCSKADNCWSSADDIMLIQLNSSVDYSAYVAPLDLAPTCASVGTRCRVMGWGTVTTPQETYPKVPHCVDIKILANEVCQAAYPWDVNENMICAGDMAGGKDSCWGDSGGPLVCQGKLQGIVSTGGFPCAQPSQPGIYTNVCKFLDWIEGIIGSY